MWGCPEVSLSLRDNSSKNINPSLRFFPHLPLFPLFPSHISHFSNVAHFFSSFFPHDCAILSSHPSRLTSHFLFFFLFPSVVFFPSTFLMSSGPHILLSRLYFTLAHFFFFLFCFPSLFSLSTFFSSLAPHPSFLPSFLSSKFTSYLLSVSLSSLPVSLTHWQGCDLF